MSPPIAIVACLTAPRAHIWIADQPDKEVVALKDPTDVEAVQPSADVMVRRPPESEYVIFFSCVQWIGFYVK
jgi:hypothetical protein